MNSIEIRRKALLFRLFLLEKHYTQSLLNGHLLIDKTDRKQGSYLLLGLSLPFLEAYKKPASLCLLVFTPHYTPCCEGKGV